MQPAFRGLLVLVGVSHFLVWLMFGSPRVHALRRSISKPAAHAAARHHGRRNDSHRPDCRLLAPVLSRRPCSGGILLFVAHCVPCGLGFGAALFSEAFSLPFIFCISSIPGGDGLLFAVLEGAASFCLSHGVGWWIGVKKIEQVAPANRRKRPVCFAGHCAAVAAL
jgi:hypothetical protein